MTMDAKLNFRRGTKVWFEDKQLAWMEAEVTDVNGINLSLITTSGEKVSTTTDKVLPRDPDVEHLGVEDMTKLAYLNEPGVLYNLARRYALNDIYTYTGSILIAVNPFTKLPHLYNMHMMDQYNGRPFGELNPHVFAIADASYRAMMIDGRSQSILVSGESGAGKTETTKLIMQYLTYVGGRAAMDDRTVEQQVLESNPLLEAFGNAKTIRNNNSSRFGKFVEIHFDKTGRISGAAIRTYLLERSRVVQITHPERNYHCFYQLCASSEDAKKYEVDDPAAFHYLNQSRAFELEGVDNAEEYLKTRRAMDIVGIGLKDQEWIFQTLAAILHLGNVEFSPGEEDDSSVIKDHVSGHHLQMAAKLFMCDPELLRTTLCTRSIQTHEGSIVKALDCNAAVANRDTLAKTVYSHLFDWLVDKINKSVGQDEGRRYQIGLLDIYGFECFQVNSFEQFCINFANEKLQQHFNQHVFKMEQEEYSKEEIDWSYIEFIDNQDVLDLIEKKPIGVISLLDEACMFPKSTHETFCTKLFQSLSGKKRLEKPKFSQTEFTISHYAGQVTYKTDSFLDKNKDYIVVEHQALLSSSSCPFISELFPPLVDDSSKSAYKFSSVASRFKNQLQALMEILNSTEPHYIRCVKPNSSNVPHKFENQSVLHQLRCGGVLEAIRISLAGYPTRSTYPEFLHRFWIIAREVMDGSYDEKMATSTILQKMKLENYQLGKSKVFLRAGQIANLDGQRAEILDTSAKSIQGRWRAYVAYKDFTMKRLAAINLQAYCRGCAARNIYTAKRQLAATILLQRHIRSWLAREHYLRLGASALVIQTGIRAWLVRQDFQFLRQQRAAGLVQGMFKTWRARSYFVRYRKSVISIQCLWRKKLARRELHKLKQEANETGALRVAKTKLEKKVEDVTWRLELEKKLRVSRELAKVVQLAKHQKALQNLQKELDAAKLSAVGECKKNALLQEQLEISLKEKEDIARKLEFTAEQNKEILVLKNSVDSLQKKNELIERKLCAAENALGEKEEKFKEIDAKCTELQEVNASLEEKLLNKEDEIRVLRQKALSVSPTMKRANFDGSRVYAEKLSAPEEHPTVDQKGNTFESPTPSKVIMQSGIPSERRAKLTAERHQDYHAVILRCVKDDLGFSKDKPVAACVIYRCLVHWRAFEAERTTIFDYIIESINESIEVRDTTQRLPYWLSNTSALLCLVQKNMKSGAALTTPQRWMSRAGLIGRMTQSFRSPNMQLSGSGEVMQVETRYPVILFKQQLTACLEKIFGLIRDSLKKEISPLLNLCIQAPKVKTSSGRTHGPAMNTVQKSANVHWKSIINYLDELMKCLHENCAPSFLIRKLITQAFSFINMQLFNSLLLRRECCSFSNGEYVKAGLVELEEWIGNATEEYAGTSWDELKYIRQAVGFLVIHQKRRKNLEDIQNDLCPALTIQQLYRICTLYWDDKYGTQSVSSEVVSQMREIVSKDSSNFMSNSFLLDDDLSITFAAEDLSKAIPNIHPGDIELSQSFLEMPALHFLRN